MKPQATTLRTVSVHVLFWIVYIVSEYFANLMHLRTSENLRFFRSLLLSMPILMISTYFITWYAVPRFLKTERWLPFLLCALGAAIFVFCGRLKWLEVVNYLENNAFYYRVPVAKVLTNVIRDYAIVALAVCIYIIGDYRNEQRTKAALIKSKAEVEIKLLKGQLHPHFLFNSLNNIYSLALLQSDLTADSILKLTELLDYLVYRANLDQVPLSRELQLLHNYIGLEQLRYGDHLRIETDMAVKNDGLPVAPLLLLPFAENCFKHGGPGQDGLFHVDLQLTADDHQLIFQIHNSKKNNPQARQSSGGLGLQNIRQRLSLLYPNRHQLHIEQLPEAYRVRLEINLRDEKI